MSSLLKYVVPVVVIVLVLGGTGFLAYKYGYNQRVIQEKEAFAEALREERERVTHLQTQIRQTAVRNLKKDEQARRAASRLQAELAKALSNDRIEVTTVVDTGNPECAVSDDVFRLLVETQTAANGN